MGQNQALILHKQQLKDEILDSKLTFYPKLNVKGKVKVMLKVINLCSSKIVVDPYSLGFNKYSLACNAEEIYIERERASWKLNEDYLTIGKSMIDELNNYYEK